MGVDDTTEKAKQATKEIRRLIEGPLQDAIRAQQEGAHRALSEARARTAATEAQIKDRLAHMPKKLGSVNDITFDNSGRIVGPIRMIGQWDDGYKHLVYTETIKTGGSLQMVNPSQIQPLSERIQTQQAVFEGLNPTEQERIQAGFKSGDKTIDTTPYSAYLQNELLRRRFDELKQNPPRPFDNK